MNILYWFNKLLEKNLNKTILEIITSIQNKTCVDSYNVEISTVC